MEGFYGKVRANIKEGCILSDQIALSNITIFQKDTANKIREAYVEGFTEPFYFGVHGGVRDFYKAETEIEYPSTLDHIVAAAGG